MALASSARTALRSRRVRALRAFSPQLLDVFQKRHRTLLLSDDGRAAPVPVGTGQGRRRRREAGRGGTDFAERLHNLRALARSLRSAKLAEPRSLSRPDRHGTMGRPKRQFASGL